MTFVDIVIIIIILLFSFMVTETLIEIIVYIIGVSVLVAFFKIPFMVARQLVLDALRLSDDDDDYEEEIKEIHKMISKYQEEGDVEE